MRKRTWIVLAAVVLVAAGVGVWLATRPPTMFVLGVYALDGEEALIATRRNEDDDTRFWIAKVRVGAGTVWATELPASVMVTSDRMAAVSHAGSVVVALDEEYHDAVGPAAVVSLDLATGSLRHTTRLPAGWSYDGTAPVAAGRWAVFAGEVKVDASCEGVKCSHEPQAVAMNAENGSSVTIGHVGSRVPCDLQLDLENRAFMVPLGDRLVSWSWTSGLHVVDLAEARIWKTVPQARVACRDGEDLIISDAVGAARLDRQGGLERIPGPAEGIVGCAPLGDALVWWDVGRGAEVVLRATDRLGRERWRRNGGSLIDGPWQALTGGAAAVAATAARYLPVFAIRADAGLPRWLDLETGAVGPLASFGASGVHAPIWIGDGHVAVQDQSSLAIFDTRRGTLLDVLAVEAGEGHAAGGRLWLAAPTSSEWTTIDELPWVVLDPEGLAVVGAGGDWRPRSVKAELEARYGPYPSAASE